MSHGDNLAFVVHQLRDEGRLAAGRGAEIQNRFAGLRIQVRAAPAACWGPGRKTSPAGNSPATPAADAISARRPDFPPASRAGRNRIPHFPRASGRADRRRLFGERWSPAAFWIRDSRDSALQVQVLTRAKVFGGVLFHSISCAVFSAPQRFCQRATSHSGCDQPRAGWEIFRSASSFRVASASRK